MKYLIKYSAYYIYDYEDTEQDLESLCKAIALLENRYKNDKHFCYEIFELKECNNKLVTDNKIYLKFKNELEFEQIIRNLKELIYSKKREILNQEYTKNKYGMWEKYDEQMSVMEHDLKILEDELELQKQKDTINI